MKRARLAKGAVKSSSAAKNCFLDTTIQDNHPGVNLSEFASDFPMKMNAALRLI